MYVGETGNSIYTRHQLNISRIRTGRNGDDVTQHFREEQEHTLENYKIFGIEKTSKTDEFRKIREAFWIKKLQTAKPNGLNTKKC